MLNGLRILVVEDEALVALELATSIEEMGGCTIGPVARVADGIVALQTEAIDAAILDANLLDGNVTPIAEILLRSGVPFVIHTGTGPPADLANRHPDLPLVMKPAEPEVVISELLKQVSGPSRLL